MFSSSLGVSAVFLHGKGRRERTNTHPSFVPKGGTKGREGEEVKLNVNDGGGKIFCWGKKRRQGQVEEVAQEVEEKGEGRETTACTISGRLRGKKGAAHMSFKSRDEQRKKEKSLPRAEYVDGGGKVRKGGRLVVSEGEGGGGRRFPSYLEGLRRHGLKKKSDQSSILRRRLINPGRVGSSLKNRQCPVGRGKGIANSGVRPFLFAEKKLVLTRSRRASKVRGGRVVPLLHRWGGPGKESNWSRKEGEGTSPLSQPSTLIVPRKGEVMRPCVKTNGKISMFREYNARIHQCM